VADILPERGHDCRHCNGFRAGPGPEWWGALVAVTLRRTEVLTDASTSPLVWRAASPSQCPRFRQLRLDRSSASRKRCWQGERWPKSLADGPTFTHAMTKRCIHQEWNMDIDDAIEAEAQAQAICMQTKDYERAYEAFVARTKPAFRGD